MAKFNQTKQKTQEKINLTDKQFESMYKKLPDPVKIKLNANDIAELVVYTFKLKERTKKYTIRRAMKVSEPTNHNHKKIGRPKGAKDKKPRTRRTKEELGV